MGCDPLENLAEHIIANKAANVLELGDVDRLSTLDASVSTLILTDDNTDQTLTGSLGKLNLVTGGDDFNITLAVNVFYGEVRKQW